MHCSRRLFQLCRFLVRLSSTIGQIAPPFLCIHRQCLIQSPAHWHHAYSTINNSRGKSLFSKQDRWQCEAKCTAEVWLFCLFLYRPTSWRVLIPVAMTLPYLQRWPAFDGRGRGANNLSVYLRQEKNPQKQNERVDGVVINRINKTATHRYKQGRKKWFEASARTSVV